MVKLLSIMAITVALNPGPKLQEKARLLNEKIVKENPESFRFDGTHSPHLTLVQMIIKNEDLTDVQQIVREEAKNFISLKTKNFQASKQGLIDLNFSGSKDLSDLQARLAKKLTLYKQKASQEAFFTPPEVTSEFMNYAQNFLPENSETKYHPHMTLGVGKKFHQKAELENYTFNEIRIYQIGHFGTARKLLFEAPLDSRK